MEQEWLTALKFSLHDTNVPSITATSFTAAETKVEMFFDRERTMRPRLVYYHVLSYKGVGDLMALKTAAKK